MRYSRPTRNADGHLHLKVDLRGYALMHEPLYNKGSGFSKEERETFGLEGLMPGASVGMDVQVRRALEQLEEASSDFQKYLQLSNLQDRNEHLYYRLLVDNKERIRGTLPERRLFLI